MSGEEDQCPQAKEQRVVYEHVTESRNSEQSFFLSHDPPGHRSEEWFMSTSTAARAKPMTVEEAPANASGVFCIYVTSRSTKLVRVRP